jgi:flagella basal body P-ring formation protein FlgA
LKGFFALAMLVAAFAAPACALGQTATTTTQVVSAARLMELADRTVHAVINGPDREVRQDYKFTDQPVPVGKVTISVAQSQYNPTYIAIPLTIAVDGKPVRTIIAGYRIVTFIHTAVAARDLQAGAVLTDDNVTLGRVESNGRGPVDIAMLVGRKLNVAVGGGKALFFEQTGVNQLVIAGQPVVYILHDGPVAVSADVVARTGGGMGQVVAVYNPATRKALSGVVTGPGQVEYTLPGGDAQ